MSTCRFSEALPADHKDHFAEKRILFDLTELPAVDINCPMVIEQEVSALRHGIRIRYRSGMRLFRRFIYRQLGWRSADQNITAGAETDRIRADCRNA